MEKRTVIDVVKDNKREIFIVGGSALMLTVGVVCLTKSAKLNLEVMKYRNDSPLGYFKPDILKEKAIKGMCATVEYIDGEIGIIEVDSPGVLDTIYSLLFPGE